RPTQIHGVFSGGRSAPVESDGGALAGAVGWFLPRRLAVATSNMTGQRRWFEDAPDTRPSPIRDASSRSGLRTGRSAEGPRRRPRSGSRDPERTAGGLARLPRALLGTDPGRDQALSLLAGQGRSTNRLRRRARIAVPPQAGGLSGPRDALDLADAGHAHHRSGLPATSLRPAREATGAGGPRRRGLRGISSLL